MFDTPIILENERAKLIPLEVSHTEALWKIASNQDLWKIALNCISSEEDMVKYIRKALEEKGNGVSYPFAIYDKKAEIIAGSTRYGVIVPEHKRLEIGWTWMGKQFQGTGLNKACKHLLFSYAFDTLGMNRVELKTDALNMQSRRAMEKVGAKFEGIFRSHCVTYSGRIRDSIYYSMIRSEWEEIKGRVFEDTHSLNNSI